MEHDRLVTAAELGDAFYHPDLVAKLFAGETLERRAANRERVGP